MSVCVIPSGKLCWSQAGKVSMNIFFCTKLFQSLEFADSCFHFNFYCIAAVNLIFLLFYVAVQSKPRTFISHWNQLLFSHSYQNNIFFARPPQLPRSFQLIFFCVVVATRVIALVNFSAPFQSSKFSSAMQFQLSHLISLASAHNITSHRIIFIRAGLGGYENTTPNKIFN